MVNGTNVLTSNLAAGTHDIGIQPSHLIDAINAGLGQSDWQTGQGIGDAPSDGNIYGRQNSGWVTVSSGGIGEAPTDGNTYVRQNFGWVVGGISDAPYDGNYYARQNGNWSSFSP
jgi:hypothetical protein